MAKGRMLNRNICESNSFAAIKNSNAQLLFVLLTSWWDDHGKMIGDEVWIKGNLTRKLSQFTLKEIKKCLTIINDTTKVHWWVDDNGNKWLYWPEFNDHQTISEAKKTKNLLPSPKFPKIPQKSAVTREVEVKIREVEEEEKAQGAKAPPPGEIFFNYYLLKTKKAFKLTPDKIELIKKRLADGFTVDQLKQAVDNFVADDWEGRPAHLDLIYCIGKQKGKPDNLEKWLNIKPQSLLDKYEVRK